MDETATTRSDLDPIGTGEFEELGSDQIAPPSDGITIYLPGASQPSFRSSGDDFVIGRKAESSRDVECDLSQLGGYALGLSRRHARIRRTASGYEIIDLASRNGTWLNEKRLTPNQPYPLPSGSQIRLARMRFFVHYRSVTEARQKA